MKSDQWAYGSGRTDGRRQTISPAFIIRLIIKHGLETSERTVGSEKEIL